MFHLKKALLEHMKMINSLPNEIKTINTFINIENIDCIKLCQDF